jgi:hypothetical protein
MTIKMAFNSVGRLLEQRLAKAHPIDSEEMANLKALHRSSQAEKELFPELQQVHQKVARLIAGSLSPRFDDEALTEALLNRFFSQCRVLFYREFHKRPSWSELIREPVQFDTHRMSQGMARILRRRGVPKKMTGALASAVVRTIELTLFGEPKRDVSSRLRRRARR